MFFSFFKPENSQIRPFFTGQTFLSDFCFAFGLHIDYDLTFFFALSKIKQKLNKITSL